VSALQRLSAGEPIEELKEEANEGQSRSGLETESDPELEWGPKDYSYDASGNVTQIGVDSYAYDTAGRLIRSTVGGKTETFKYDAYGNLVEKAIAGANPDVIAVDGTSNRLTGVSYDAAGNVTTRRNGAYSYGTYTYDSFGMLTSFAGQQGTVQSRREMVYDANDERIGLIHDDRSRWWIRDLEGQVIREYVGSPTYDEVYWFWKQDYVRAGGQVIGGEKVEFSFVDQTARTTTWGGKRHYLSTTSAARGW
jgi:YD repeat-containing protein